MKTFISTIIVGLAILQSNVNYQCKSAPVNVTETTKETIGADQVKPDEKYKVDRSIDEVFGETREKNQTKQNEENHRNSTTEQSTNNDTLLEEAPKISSVNITETTKKAIGSDQVESEKTSTVLSLDDLIGKIFENQTKNSEENDRNSTTEQSTNNYNILEEESRSSLDAVHRCPVDKEYIDGECRQIIGIGN